MRPFTLVMAFYQNSQMLAKHIDLWLSLPAEIQKAMQVIIVDDGSPPGRTAFEVLCSAQCQRVELYEMRQDIPWGQDACRNIGVKYAKTEYVVLTDMDHLVPAETWQRLMTGPLDASKVYRFSRVSAPEMKPHHRHPNSYAMTTHMFWEVGGYDERLAGKYGTDGDLVRRILKHTEIVQLPEVLIRVPREVIPDASTTTLERKNPQQKKEINDILKDRNQRGLAPLHFQFPYQRVL